jgi:hypothetical protein
MKTKRRIIVAVLALLVIALGIFIFSKRPTPPSTMAALQGLSRERVVTAVQAFTRDRKTDGGALSNTVALHDLLSGGYLRSRDIRGLDGKDVTVSLTADQATSSTIWIAVRESDGSQVGLLGDGKIAVLPKP